MLYSKAPSYKSSSSELQTTLPSPMSRQAADRVFSTNELLCGIIAHLPLNDIITTTGVCRTWRSAVAADPVVQQLLFLKPVEIDEVLAENPHILDLETPIPFDECVVIGELHPWISEIIGHVQTGYPYPHGGHSLHPGTNLDFLSHEGSWREMFATQPPCKRATVLLCSNMSNGNEHEAKLVREDGIRMGELYDFVHEELSYNPECSGSVVHFDRFDTEEYVHQARFYETRCKVRDGEVCRPAQMPKKPTPSTCSEFGVSEASQDDQAADGERAILDYGDYDSDDDYSDDYEDMNEFGAEEAEEADRYFQW